MKLCEVLKQRNMFSNCSDEVGLTNNVENVKAYIGIDPTADSLHIGHLTSIMFAKHWENITGKSVVFLIGGRTGKIGDPTGKDKSRNKLSLDIINNNCLAIKAQLIKLGIEEDQIINNIDNPITIEEVADKFTVNSFLTHSTFKKRIESGEPLFMNEFLYPIIQASDFLWLRKTHGVNVQIGGQDQWFNMCAGLQLVKNAFVVTMPLLTDNKGNKFGKSEGNAIWLDINKTPLKKFYNFWRSIRDEEVKKLMLIFTSISEETINTTIDLDINEAKRILAYNVCKLVHKDLIDSENPMELQEYIKEINNE